MSHHIDRRQHIERLHALGVTNELFEGAIAFATSETRQNTKYDAPAMPGITFWSRANRFLAEALTDPGATELTGGEAPSPVWRWTKRDSILRVIHPSGSHAITAVSGEQGVGDPDKPARTKNPKGATMARLVEENGYFFDRRGQGLLASPDELQFGRELDSIPLWFFLYKRGTDGLVTAELSLPVEMKGKHVNRWRERIPLTLPDVDPGIDLTIDLPDAPEPDVPVQRKREG